MAVITLQEAETQLSHWLNYVALGEEILIANDGQTGARTRDTSHLASAASAWYRSGETVLDK